MIGCENNVKDKTSKHHGTKCNFVMSLTDAEIIKFNNYELNINEILEKSDDVCKKCSSKLYKRTITKFSGVSVKMRCRNAYKSENPCTYSKEII
jgi:hypothetical protein